MKAKAVSASRDKRGLRCVGGAEPQVVGLTPQTTLKRKADTMKTYILGNPKTVEPQIPRRASRAATPLTPATASEVLGVPSARVRNFVVGSR